MKKLEVSHNQDILKIQKIIDENVTLIADIEVRINELEDTC